MSKNRKGVDLDKVSNGVKKAGKIVGIIFNIFWILVGIAVIAAFVLVAVRIGQALQIDFSKIF